jgi:hypothetical protein
MSINEGLLESSNGMPQTETTESQIDQEGLINSQEGESKGGNQSESCSSVTQLKSINSDTALLAGEVSYLEMF